MTIDELSNLYNIRQRIAELRELLVIIETRATKTTTKSSGMPSGGGISDKTASGGELADVRDQLLEMEAREESELVRLCKYIASVEDAFIAKLLRLRFVNGLKWSDVAKYAGGNNSADGVRKAVFRFIEKT